MTDPIRDPGRQPLEPLRPIAPAAPASGADAARKALRESEFRALLEDLEASTEALERSANPPSAVEGSRSSDDLHDSLRQAKDSFRDALEIGERLLEAYREARIDPQRLDGGSEDSGTR